MANNNIDEQIKNASDEQIKAILRILENNPQTASEKPEQAVAEQKPEPALMYDVGIKGWRRG